MLCLKSASALLPYPSMVMLPDHTRVLRTLSAFVVLSCLSGSSPRAHGSRCTDRKAAQPASMINGRGEEWRMLAHGFWDAICLALCAVRGRTIRGKDGGAKSRPIMYRRSC